MPHSFLLSGAVIFAVWGSPFYCLGRSESGSVANLWATFFRSKFGRFPKNCYLCPQIKAMMRERKYPIGIQTFSRVIREGFIYVDKTDLVWQLSHYSTFVFMSRPRRFGKSLLTSTLESYFRGEKELFEEDIMRMSQKFGCSPEEMFFRIKDRYDGYHFSAESEDIYNPFSLLNAFGDEELNNYWFSSGTPTFLIRQMQFFRTDITSFENLEAFSSDFDLPTEAMTNALPLLYQSGYLTIKGFDRESEMYTLSIPNQEVRISFQILFMSLN